MESPPNLYGIPAKPLRNSRQTSTEFPPGLYGIPAEPLRNSRQTSTEYLPNLYGIPPNLYGIPRICKGIAGAGVVKVLHQAAGYDPELLRNSRSRPTEFPGPYGNPRHPLTEFPGLLRNSGHTLRKSRRSPLPEFPCFTDSSAPSRKSRQPQIHPEISHFPAFAGQMK